MKIYKVYKDEISETSDMNLDSDSFDHATIVLLNKIGKSLGTTYHDDKMMVLEPLDRQDAVYYIVESES